METKEKTTDVEIMDKDGPVTNLKVANEVSDIKSFEGIGAYNFVDMGQVIQFSDLMARSGPMIPAFLQKQPARCMAITMRAMQWGFDPFALAMEAYQAQSNGPVAYQAKVFVAALRNMEGITLEYEYSGEVTITNNEVKSARGNVVAKRGAIGDRRCIASFEEYGKTYVYETPKLDDITIKNSPLWHNDPDQQLAYYAARGWTRRHRPGVMLGSMSSDEAQDMKDVTPKRKTGGFAQAIKQIQDQTDETEESESTQEPEQATGEEAQKSDSGDQRRDTDPDGGVVPAADQGPSQDDGDASPTQPTKESDSVLQTERQASIEGETAHNNGEKITTCPYDSETGEGNAWLTGWRIAKELAESS